MLTENDNGHMTWSPIYTREQVENIIKEVLDRASKNAQLNIKFSNNATSYGSEGAGFLTLDLDSILNTEYKDLLT